MNNRNITPEMARQELARRRAAKEELKRRKFDKSLMGNLSKIPGYATKSVLNLPESLWGLAKQVPDSINNIVKHPINSARDLVGGIARGSQNLASAGLEAGEYLTRKGAESLSGNKIPKWNAREFMGLEGNNKIDLGKYLESNNPDPLISALGQYGLGGSLGGIRMLPMMAANAATAAIQASPGQRLESGVQGAVNTALPVGAIKGINKLRPSKLFEGNLNSNQIEENLNASNGTTTGLGDVIGSPGLKRLYENVLPRVPFSGADRAMQETANQLIKKGQGHLEKLNENIPAGDKTKILQDAIKSAARDAEKQKRANYEIVNSIADKEGLLVNREKFNEKANALLSDIEKSPELKRELSPEIIADIKSYAINNKGNSLRLSNIFKGKLNDKANEFYINGKKYEYGLIKDLKDALGEDINTAIDSSTNKDLRSAYNKAQEEYGSKYKQFEDPNITKFTREGGDSDLILSNFLKTGANDRANLLAKVTAKLPKELQNLPASMYLSKAIEDGQLNPIKLRTLYHKLGEKQKETLIPDANMRKAINNYTKAIGMNTEAFQTMFNPKTGQRVLDPLIPAMQALSGSQLLGGLPGAALGIGIPAIMGRSAVKLLTNPKVRDVLAKSIIKSKKKQGK